jgi:hypothetical protein
LAVDPGALHAVAQKAHEIAQEATEVFAQFRTAINDTAAGAPGSQSAEVAQRASQAWEGWLRQQVEEISEIARRLEQTATDYRATDEGAGNVFDEYGGIWRDGPTDGGIPGATGGGFITPNTQYQPGESNNAGIPGATGGGFITPNTQYQPGD